MNDVSPEQAREMLADIDGITRRMRKTLAASSLAPNLMIWGAMWAIGFMASHFGVRSEGWFWAGMITAGALCSAIATWRATKQRIVVSEEDKRLGWQLMWFWIAVLGYATTMLFVRPSVDGRDIVVNFVMFSMLGYVIMGIWLRSGALCVIGLIVTASLFAGRLAIDERYFLPWMAIFGGGGLFVSGAYIRLRWR